MTITRERTDAGSTTAWPDVLLAVLDDVLLACAERDADLFSGRTPAGRSLVELSALTRTAARGLGEDAGTCLDDGPGVVVVRDLVAATRLLARAVAGPGRQITGQRDDDGNVAAAVALRARLLRALPAA
jgi:hypothetical protein